MNRKEARQVAYQILRGIVANLIDRDLVSDHLSRGHLCEVQIDDVNLIIDEIDKIVKRN